MKLKEVDEKRLPLKIITHKHSYFFHTMHLDINFNPKQDT
jgi:hypothetical protein